MIRRLLSSTDQARISAVANLPRRVPEATRQRTTPVFACQRSHVGNRCQRSDAADISATPFG